MMDWFWVAFGVHVSGAFLAWLAYRSFQLHHNSRSFFTPTCRGWIVGLGCIASMFYAGMAFLGIGLRETWQLTLGGTIGFVASILLYGTVCFLAQLAARADMSTVQR